MLAGKKNDCLQYFASKPKILNSPKMSAPSLRDLVYNQPYLELSPDDSSQVPSETLLRAISSSSLFPVHYANHDNPPKKVSIGVVNKGRHVTLKYFIFSC